MQLERESTRKALASIKPHAINSEWKTSLRSPIASTSVPLLSQRSRSRDRTIRSGQSLHLRSPSPGQLDLGTIRTRSPSPSLRGTAADVTIGIAKKLATNLMGSAELQSIENDYIKNLQQQIYFLDLEANYLREEAKKSADLQPKMAAEAERMLENLRSFQSDCDGLGLELMRLEGSLTLATSERDGLVSRLNDAQEKTERETRMLGEERIKLLSEVDRVRSQSAQKISELSRATAELERLSAQVQEAEANIRVLKHQLENHGEQHHLAKIELAEKEHHCSKAEAHIRDVEEQFYGNSARLREQAIHRLELEVAEVKRQLTEAEARVDKDSQMRSQAENQRKQLVDDNTMLTQKIDQLTRLLRKEIVKVKSAETETVQQKIQIQSYTEREFTLNSERKRMNSELTEEQERSNSYLSQVREQEETNAGLESDKQLLEQNLKAMELRVSSAKMEKSQLMSDKQILMEHLADVQSKISQQDELIHSANKMKYSLDRQISQQEREKETSDQMWSKKWQQFDALAQSVKNFSEAKSLSTNQEKPKSSQSSRSKPTK